MDEGDPAGGDRRGAVKKTVIPAKAGIQYTAVNLAWIPASAGMTAGGARRPYCMYIPPFTR